MMSVSDDKHADIVDAFSTTSRDLDDIYNINNNFYFDNLSCTRDFCNQSFMATWCINKRESMALIFFSAKLLT